MKVKEQEMRLVGEEFGEKIGEYKVRKSNHVMNIFGAVLFIVVALSIFVYMLQQIILEGNHYDVKTIIKTFAPMSALGIILLLITFWLVRAFLNNKKKLLVIYTKGIYYKDKNGTKRWLWENISSFWADVTKHFGGGVNSGATHVYQLVHKNGEKIIIGDLFPNVEEIATVIRSLLNPILYKKVARRYNKGKICKFGDVLISKSRGLTIKKRIFSWDEIGEVNFQKGMLTVKRKGEGKRSRVKIPASSIPNLEILLTMIDQVIGVNQGKLD